MKTLAVFVALFASVFAADWNYADKGPAYWKENIAGCDGDNQSPIDIIEKYAVYKNLPVSLAGYSTAMEWSCNNNGHTIGCGVPPGNMGTYVTNAKDAYNEADNTWAAAQFHFHWDLYNTEGSENRLNGMAYPLEMHIVHANTKYSDDITQYSDGALVLGFFFEIGGDNPAFQKIAQLIPLIPNKGNETTSAKLAPAALIAGSVEDGKFFHWRGSLTTPGCAEAVSWYMFRKPITISQAQMDMLRNTLYENEAGDDEHVMERNWRDTQPLGRRTLYKSWEDKPDPTPAPPPTCGSTSVTFSVLTVLAAAFLSISH